MEIGDTNTGKQDAVRIHSGDSVGHSEPGQGRANKPSTSGRKPEACPPVLRSSVPSNDPFSIPFVPGQSVMPFASVREIADLGAWARVGAFASPAGGATTSKNEQRAWGVTTRDLNGHGAPGVASSLLPGKEINSPGVSEGRSPSGADRVAGSTSSFLDEIERNRNSEPATAKELHSGPSSSCCGRHSIVGRALDGRKILAIRLGCKAWSCPRCGKRKAKRAKRAIIANAERSRLCRFLTLTLDPARIEGEPVQYLRACWNMMRVYLHRTFGSGIQYIAVLEFQKNGNPHLHILISRYIPQPWLMKSWQAVGGGWSVDIRYVDLHRAGHYLAKYLTKDLLLSAPPKSRRITCSRGIRLYDKPEPLYEWLPNPLRITLDELARRCSPIPSDCRYDPENGELQSFTVASLGT